MTPSTDERARVVLDNIRARRTLPWTYMKPDPIEAHHLEALLEAANWAPTHKHTEPWRFVIFTGAGRASLADLLGRTYRETIGEKFTEKKYQKTVTRPAAVPLVMAIVMEPSEKADLPEFEEILAVGCAMQNFHLAAQALGIGCAWSTPKYLDHPNIRSFLGLTGRMRCLGFYYVGYPADGWPGSLRRPIAEKVRHVTA